MNGVLTTRQIAERLRIIPEVVRRILQRGVLKGFKTSPGGRWRVKEKDLIEYIERQTGTVSGHTESAEKRRVRKEVEMVYSLVDGIKRVAQAFNKHPGTIAVMGLLGVMLFGFLNWTLLMMASLVIGLVAYLIHLNQRKKASRKTRK